MAKPLTCAGMLLVANALTLPVMAQEPVAEVDKPATASPVEDSAATPEIAAPGGEIVVLGRRTDNIEQDTTQVITLLSNEEIARTGEGDIAGALGRVTGLSVVGGGFVYVRGLGDRYSQALLNGSPLPSPEPLRRAVPLDLFPTDVIASSLVQKTFSPNFPGEFGGGVINLTTLATPTRPFLDFSFGINGETETSGAIGYTHRGSRSDWTGYDSGGRDIPSALQAFLSSGQRLSAGNVDSGEIAKQLVNSDNAVVLRNDKMPANYSFAATGGTSWLLGETELGLIATGGFSNKWRTRDNIEQTPGSFDLSVIDKDYHTVSTESHAVVNGLVGLGLEFGDGSKLRWTNLYVHDTLKRTSLAEGRQNNQRLGADFLDQNTGWYERQLFDTQLSGEFRIDPVTINGRASYARSSREAPFELGLGYVRTNQTANPYGAYFINRLDNGQSGFAQMSFSDLSEDLWSAGVDVSGRAWGDVVLTAGLDFTDTKRDSARREFQIIAPSSFPSGVGMLRPDYLLSPLVIDTFDIGLIETTESDPAFAARLRTQAGYLQAQSEVAEGVEVNVGARFERGEQSVEARQVFTTAIASNASTSLKEDYVLPAATVTYKFHDDMQLRFNASKTIARPQFRELIFQAYFDPESNRAYRGNPLLVDSQFVNAEARYEWYFATEQKFSAAAFYKQIDKPIEAFTGFNDNSPVTSFANAPGARLYGVETDVQKYFPMELFTENAFFASRRLVLVGNYTYTQSKISVGAGDTVTVFGTTVQPASNFFVDGAPLTGQSDHLVNVQFGFEDEQSLSQQTLLLSYSSDRVTSRGAAGLPDIYESPGFNLDFVARQGLELFGQELELKFEARNLLGRDYKEFQQRAGNVVYYNRYAVGTSLSASVSAKF